MMRPSLSSLALLVAVAVPSVAQEPAAFGPHGRLPPQLDCSACHTSEGWKPAKAALDFDHDRGTRFPLTGRHRDLTCARCHLGLKFEEPKAALSDCEACHVDVHQGTLPRDCGRCHSPATFKDVPGVAIHARTAFPLTGAHLQAPCEGCHRDDRGGAYSPLPRDCYSCHRTDYENAALIDHSAAGFGTDCVQCHEALTWTGGVAFDHVASAGYPLEGAHADLRCGSCHVQPGMAPIFSPAGPEDCIACHQTDYDREHGGGFPATCLDCHSQVTWGDAHFDHAAVASFQLMGAHQQLACDRCHVVPGYELRFTVPSAQEDCVACHQADYQREHVGTGFPTTCLSCHNQDTWSGARFDHTGFPIYSGAHAGRWTNCATCHTVPGDYQSFTCLTCHGKTETDGRHQAVSGYAYDSGACYSCHPNGRAE